MLYFERIRKTIGGQDITLTSWLDRKGNIYRALAPHYIHIVHDWWGVTGTSRAMALHSLSELLAAYLQGNSPVTEDAAGHEKGIAQMIGFERARQSVQGHGVTVTSWFDPEKQVWRASAPAYIHVIHDWPAASLQGRTRQEAVNNLASLLSHYFEDATANV